MAAHRTRTESTPLFDALADDYDHHFASTAYRRAYDDLAWERVEAVLPPLPAVVLDAGCGAGRWAERLAERGYRVVGIEPAPRMAQVARERLAPGPHVIHEASIEQAELDDEVADVTLAMGSLQYTVDPAATVWRLARWTRPGGTVAVLVDSRFGRAVERIRAGSVEDGLRDLQRRRASFARRGEVAEMHLLDRETLEAVFAAAGLERVAVHGLLVSSGIVGLERLEESLAESRSEALELERRLMDVAELADLGKHLLAIGRRPQPGEEPDPRPV